MGPRLRSRIRARKALADRARPPVIGLTGGIGAGKSTALAMLERMGSAVLSTDEVVHELYVSDHRVLDAVVERLGESVAPDGVVDRAAVAARVFGSGSADDRTWLEGLLWPLVGERMLAWTSEQEHADPPPRALVVEVPLLFEAGLGDAFDATVAVVAGEALRSERAAGRGHESVDERTARQLSQQEKAARSTYVVENDGDLEELKAKLSAVLDKLHA